MPGTDQLAVDRAQSGRADDEAVENRQVGRLLRAVRIRLNLRQVDVADRAGVSQTVVSDIELGRLEDVGLRSTRSVARVLEVRLALSAQWRGGEADRLLDRAHASIVEHVVATLRSLSWEVIPEFTFNVYGIEDPLTAGRGTVGSGSCSSSR